MPDGAPAQTCVESAGYEAPVDAAGTQAHRYLLVLQYALLNVVGFGLLGGVYLQGWIDGALTGHTRWLSLGIFAVFGYGLLSCAVKVWRTSREINALKAGTPAPASRAARYLAQRSVPSLDSRDVGADLLRMRLVHAVTNIRQIADSLVFLGLIGTVIGFIVALSGVDPELAGASENVGPMVATLIDGMSIALYTTLIGAVLHVWLMMNYRLLSTGTLHLYSAIVMHGEGRVGT